MKVLRGLFYAFVVALVALLAVSFLAPQSAPAAWLKAEMAPIMFVSLVFFLLMGYPVAFSLACAAGWWVARRRRTRAA